MRAWHHMHVDLVLGDEDVYARPAALQLMAQSMTAAGVPHRTHLFAGGHKLEPVLLKRLLSVSE
jgi:hypothetical protein